MSWVGLQRVDADGAVGFDEAWRALKLVLKPGSTP
jgi:hypothetical protein